MFFASDNSGPAHPKVMEALLKTNEGYELPYGAEAAMEVVTEQVREIFEAPEAAVFLTATGTTANSLALATLSEPWHTIFCAHVAHIQDDECNAPEFYTGGAKLTLVGTDDKITPHDLRHAIQGQGNRGVHGPKRGPVALTNVTERGRVYSTSELAELTLVAHEFNLPVHLDGARFANAMVATNATPAEMTWRSRVDAVSFGGTKNGLLGVEAVIFFNPDHAEEFEFRRKRAGHLFSKHRYLSAQMSAYLTEGLWRDMATQANANAARLADGLRSTGVVTFEYEPQANMIFCAFPRAAHQRLKAAGAQYYVTSGALNGEDPTELLGARLVCDWSISAQKIDEFVGLIQS